MHPNDSTVILRSLMVLVVVQSVSAYITPVRHRRSRPDLVWLMRQRDRRAHTTDCSSQVEQNPTLQEAITKLITGNEAKGYLMKTTGAVGGARLEPAGAQLCDETDADYISPDMPIRDRAVCAFQYVESFDARRLPQTIPEVQCVCPKPTKRMILNRFPEVSCEPMMYDVPVLRFDDNCKTFTHTTQRISLACVPVFGSQSSANIQIGNGRTADIEF